jgi:hypothetical protein
MKLYKIKDIGEASALLTKGIKLVRLEKGEGAYFLFVFGNAKLAKAVGHTYWFGNLLQNVKRYNESLHNLKDMVHSQRVEVVKGRTVSVKRRH